jgi:hypothetical protein
MRFLVESLDRGESADLFGPVLLDQAAGAASIRGGDPKRAVEGVRHNTGAEGTGSLKRFHDDDFACEDGEQQVGPQRATKFGGQTHRVFTDHDTALGARRFGGTGLIGDGDGAPAHRTSCEEGELVDPGSVDRGDRPAGVRNFAGQLEGVVLGLGGGADIAGDREWPLQQQPRVPGRPQDARLRMAEPGQLRRPEVIVGSEQCHPVQAGEFEHLRNQGAGAEAADPVGEVLGEQGPVVVSVSDHPRGGTDLVDSVTDAAVSVQARAGEGDTGGEFLPGEFVEVLGVARCVVVHGNGVLSNRSFGLPSGTQIDCEETTRSAQSFGRNKPLGRVRKSENEEEDRDTINGRKGQTPTPHRGGASTCACSVRRCANHGTVRANQMAVTR